MNESRHLNLRYALLTSRSDLARYLDDIERMARSMIKRTGSHGQTPLSLIKLMASFVGRDESFLLVGIDDNDRAHGFLFALFTPADIPFAEVLALYGIGLWKGHEEEVWAMVKDWAKSLGARKIYAYLTRKPSLFYERFHKRLGFKPIGWILEADNA